MTIIKSKATLIILSTALILTVFVSFTNDTIRLGVQEIYAKRVAKPKTFALNINNQDIHEFLKIMSALTGKNIIADNKVRGKITIIASKKIPVSEAYTLMKSILQLQGYAVIEGENLTQVVPIADAISSNTSVVVGDDLSVTPSDGNTVTYIYHVKEGDTARIRNILNTMKTRNTKVLTYEDLNYILLSGMTSEITGLINIAKALDIAPPIEEGEVGDGVSKGNIHVLHLQNAKAKDLADVLSRIPFSETAKIDTSPRTPPGAAAAKTTRKTRTSKSAAAITRQPVRSQSQAKLSIVANEDTNSLIITATPEEFRQIKAVINELDIVREQVLIEALVIEVSADNSWGFGIDWMLGGASSGGTVGGSQILGSVPSFSSDTVAGKDVALPLGTGFQLGFLSNRKQLGFLLLNAQANDNNFSVLSTPQLLTVDNQEAEINVGEQFPIKKTTITDGVTTTDYELMDAALKLKITPHITNGERINLELYQEVNSVKGDTSALTADNPPVILKRDLKTMVTVEDGKTVVVGGLISNQKDETESKVPILGDIPVLGWLFKYKSVTYKKKNLLIFITPHIVTDAKKLKKLSEEKREEQKLLEK